MLVIRSDPGTAWAVEGIPRAPICALGGESSSKSTPASFRIAAVFPKILTITLLVVSSLAQDPQQGGPPVKVNVLNVCTPSGDEQKQIASALSHVPKQPLFSPDFEVARGRSSLSDKAQLIQAGQGAELSSEPITAAWVRIRREFSVQSVFSNVQYSFSADAKSMIETLVLHVREPKDLVQLSIEDSASAVTNPASMLATSTPVDRIKLERFGKSSIVLARCKGTEGAPPPDQSVYEPLFRDASAVLGRYRELLGARGTVPDELVKVVAQTPVKSRSTRKATGKKVVPKSK
jgi:hypothetical protein